MHMHHHNTGGIAIDSYACNSRLRHISAGFKAGFSMLLLLYLPLKEGITQYVQ